ncbi:MAG: ATP synthase F0 subunit B [Flavobacteriaceae bacterium]|nr:ATP synthase F0 subunit B [Flavobacteriaceae bacterium]OUX39646.1 MAG: ATP synthase F0 subunit B [Flavobacteriaceae bacterium TMED265]
MDQLLNDFSPGLFIIQTVLMLVVIFLMIKFAWKPILSALEERESGIQDALNSAQKAKKQVEAMNSDNDRLLKEARAEREEMLKEARAIKDKIIADAEEMAQAESQKIIDKAKSTIESEKKAALEDIKTEVAKLSISVAEKLLQDELAKDQKQTAHIDAIIDEVKLS